MNDLYAFVSNPNNQWVWSAVQTILVLAGFIFVRKQLRLARDQNSITHLNYFRELWESDAMLRARLAVVKGTTDDEEDFNGPEDVIATFMEDLGAAVQVGQADTSHVWSYFSYHVEGYWILLTPKIKFYRQKTSDKNYFTGFEDLYQLSCRISESKGSPKMPVNYMQFFREEEETVALFLSGK